ncbi:thiamine-phosphate kinase [Leucobacter tenebrionis]|uniref:thiamine-phosphate kinase n=1 Tax=Leucobacter tenebrionis TaxID=2873270 RepID=UPI001CA63783|nr:thiamine-phosphate kinase [Leucobacter tenebrionis]QZY52325.1 thiamine-phosphate kinase [Leucobacter tenebrionis]
MKATVGELGEREVLARVLAGLGSAEAARLGPGDDCAVLGFAGDAVVTTDTMIEGPDFRLAWHDGFDLGWKLAATNLSDVAAMGARPTALTVALAVPRETPVELLERIARGLDAACRELAPGCGVVGGDLGRAPVVTASVTALGDLEGRQPVTRSGARPGDVIAYAGPLGLAGLGLSLLFAEAADPDGTAHARSLPGLRRAHPVEIAAQLAPTPPIGLGVRAAEAGATAMMDVSDSLSIDADRMARASGAVLDLDAALLEAGFGAQLGASGARVPVEAMLTGGEDHGLLATFPAAGTLPDGFVRIGEVRALGAESRGSRAELPTVTLDGAPLEPRGWDPYTVRLPGA